MEYNRRRKASSAKTAQPDLDALNAIYGTRFRHGQQVIVRGHRYTVIGAKWGAWLRVKNDKGKFGCRPYDAYPVINLSGTVTFDGWTMGPSGKLKIKKWPWELEQKGGQQ